MKRSASLLHPRSALVVAVGSSSPTLPIASNLADVNLQAFMQQAETYGLAACGSPWWG